MQKIKYISNKELLAEIQRSKTTFCHFDAPEYAAYDVIIASLEQMTTEVIEATIQTKIARLLKAQSDTSTVTPESLVFRVMSDMHVPPETDEKRRKKSKRGEWVAKTNFPPFQHFVLRDSAPIEVGRSHWHGALDGGKFSVIHGNITDRLASMFMLMVERYARGGSWRGYCVDDKTEALVQRGWVTMDDIREDDMILSYDDGKLKWSKIKSIFRDDYEGKMHHLTVTGMDALVTPHHKFITDSGLKQVERLIETDRVILDESHSVEVSEIDFQMIDYRGKVWCPETEYGSFMARRNGYVYLTGNTYNDEMRSLALVQLIQVGLQFDESRSDNPFAFYTQIVKNVFRRVLNLERRHQDIRDDLLIMSGAQPSYTRQIDNEFEQRDEWQKASAISANVHVLNPENVVIKVEKQAKKRGRKPKVPVE